MTELTLVRHGQANSTAQTEEDYDRLSDLGRQQAAWLGDYFAERGIRFDRVIAGTLARQQGTAEAICAAIGGDIETDARLNEIEYFKLAQARFDQDGTPMPTGQIDFFRHVPETLGLWQAGAIAAQTESFADFEARIRELMDLALEDGQRVLFVTSGGVISKFLRLALQVGTDQMAYFLLQTYNSSVHRMHAFQDELRLESFNNTPHLDLPERVSARTYV